MTNLTSGGLAVQRQWSALGRRLKHSEHEVFLRSACSVIWNASVGSPLHVAVCVWWETGLGGCDSDCEASQGAFL